MAERSKARIAKKRPKKAENPLFVDKTPVESLMERPWKELTRAERRWYEDSRLPKFSEVLGLAQKKGRKRRPEYDNAFDERERARLFKFEPPSYRKQAEKIFGTHTTPEEEAHLLENSAIREYKTDALKHKKSCETDALRKALNRRKGNQEIPDPPKRRKERVKTNPLVSG